jgi:hypothetical protein
VSRAVRRHRSLSLLAFVSSSIAACSTSKPVDIAKERDAVESAVCSQHSLPAVKSALDRIGFEYFVFDSDMQLQSIRHYEPDLLVEPVITLTLTFDKAGAMTSCTVKAIFTSL